MPTRVASAGVDAAELEGDPAAEDRGVLERPRLVPRHPEQAEVGEALDDAHREELGARPVVVDDRLDLGLDVGAQAHQHVLLAVLELGLEAVEVARDRREGGGGGHSHAGEPTSAP